MARRAGTSPRARHFIRYNERTTCLAFQSYSINRNRKPTNHIISRIRSSREYYTIRVQTFTFKYRRCHSKFPEICRSPFPETPESRGQFTKDPVKAIAPRVDTARFSVSRNTSTVYESNELLL